VSSKKVAPDITKFVIFVNLEVLLFTCPPVSFTLTVLVSVGSPPLFTFLPPPKGLNF